MRALRLGARQFMTPDLAKGLRLPRRVPEKFLPCHRVPDSSRGVSERFYTVLKGSRVFQNLGSFRELQKNVADTGKGGGFCFEG